MNAKVVFFSVDLLIQQITVISSLFLLKKKFEVLFKIFFDTI